MFAGGQVVVQGFARFDRLSRRGFLYGSVKEMIARNYKRTIFLELGNENYTSLEIPDGTYVLVVGYLSPDLHGPLGVYPGHIIVDKIQRLGLPNSTRRKGVRAKGQNGSVLKIDSRRLAR